MIDDFATQKRRLFLGIIAVLIFILSITTVQKSKKKSDLSFRAVARNLAKRCVSLAKVTYSAHEISRYRSK
jgi:cyanate lyase